ncbi:MAG: hypothetical protein H6592_06560 [Flavobacteriales bacterium]|nr:hypothetical protein [Flavobacteriales bacterium]
MKPAQARLLAYYHLAGGVLGCALVIIMVLQGNELSTEELLVCFAAFLFFLLSAYCGYVGLKARSGAFLRLAFLIQLTQVFTFSVDQVFTYKFFSGLALVVGVPLKEPLIVQFKFSLSAFLVSWQQPMDSFVGLNLVALLLASWCASRLWGDTDNVRSAFGDTHVTKAS